MTAVAVPDRRLRLGLGPAVAGAAIEVHDLRKSFGDTPALAGVSFTVEAGRVLGLLGPNGAGKTTLVRILTTLLRPDGGWARVAGLDPVADPSAVREVIGLSGQFAAVDNLLTGRENLEMVGRLHHLGPGEARARARQALDRFGLTERADQLAKHYSGGMRRRLDLAASLVARPPVVVLDEPTTGLDPRSRIDTWNTIQELAAGGTTVLLTTQYLEEVDRLAHRIVVIDHGRVIAQGTPDELKDRVGADRMQVRVPHAGDLDRLAAALAPVADAPPVVDRDRQRVGLPAARGVETLNLGPPMCCGAGDRASAKEPP